MAWRRFSAPALSHGLWTGLWAALVAVVAIVVVQTLTADETPAGYRILFRLVGTAYVACGLIAWRRRPDSRSGLLMTATGFLLFVEPLLDGLRPARRSHRGPVEHHDHLAAADDAQRRTPDLARRQDAGRPVRARVRSSRPRAWRPAAATTGRSPDWRRWWSSVGCLATAVVIGLRYARASGPRRRALLPSVAGIGALLLFAVAQGGETPIWFRWVAVLSLLAVPAGFLVGLLRSRLARGGLADLFRRLPTMRGEDLQPALAQVLGDPTVEIVRGHPYAGDGRGAAVDQRRGHARLRRLARRRPRADRGGRLGGRDRARVARAAGADRHGRRRRAAAAGAQPARRRAAAARRARHAAAAGPARDPHRPGGGPGARRRPRARSSRCRSRSCASSRAGSTRRCSTTGSSRRCTRWPARRRCRPRSPTTRRAGCRSRSSWPPTS